MYLVSMTHALCACAVLFVSYFRLTKGHGHLVNPPSRSSMWDQGFKTPPNYNMNQLNCGGFYNHWILNNGKCGVCGDPYQSPAPRDNEAGGKYGKGIITRTYKSGERITVEVLVTANHAGWFEFRLCPDGSPTKPVTQSCLDRFLLPLADGSGTRYTLSSQERSVSIDVMLPQGVTCAQCVLQWKWRAGNNYGRSADGTNCKGCGPQEEFYGCSDIAITSGGGQVPVTNAPVTNPRTPPPQTTRPIVTFPPITFPQFTPAVQTFGTTRPTSKPITFPSFTRPSAAPPIVTNGPIIRSSPIPTFQGGVTIPTGFVPISIDPSLTGKPTAAPIRTNPPFVPTKSTTQLFTPSTTSRLQLITNPKTRPTTSTKLPIFHPQTTKLPLYTYPPFTLFPPFGVNNQRFTTRQSTKAPPSFYRPPTTPAPAVVTTNLPTRPSTTRIYRPPVTYRPVMTTFYRPPTTRRPTTKTTSTTTQAPVTIPARHCFAVNSWAGVPELEKYCQVLCNTGGACPPMFCSCA